MGVEQSEAVNRMRTEMLQTEVGRLGAAWVTVDACSVDGSHCEASFAIAAALEACVSLAARFEQLGIFWFDGAVFWIIPVRSGNPRMRLPPQA